MNFNIVAYRYYNPDIFHHNDKLLVAHFTSVGHATENRKCTFDSYDNVKFITKLVKLLYKNIFFDYKYYITTYPDLSSLDQLKALNHYLKLGSLEGRFGFDPAFNFDAYYRTINSTCFPRDNRNIFLHYLITKKTNLVVLLYGTCQCAIIKTILDKYYGNSIYTFEYISSHLNIKSNMPLDMYKFKKADIFIYQPVHNYNNYNTDYIIKNYLSPDCKLISAPYLIFFGYNPDNSRTDRNHKTISSKIPAGLVPYSFSKLSQLIESYNNNTITASIVQDIINRTKASDFLSPDFIEAHTKHNLDELKKREVSCTIKLADFIVSNYKKHKLFHTVDHPTNMVLNEVMKQLCPLLNLNYIDILRDREYLQNPFVSLVYPCVEPYLNLKLNYSIIMDSTEYDYDTYIKKYIEILYPEKLIKN